MYNNNRHIKPNLVDPIIEKKIIKTLNPPREDYWAPTKNILQSFYQNYIKTNIPLIIFIIILILFLIYRYRSVREQRGQEYQNIDPTQPIVSVPQQPLLHERAIDKPNDKSLSKKDTNEYTNLFLALYNQQKETMREPPVRNISNRMNPAPIPRFAYPIYPYGRGGSLAPSGSR